MFSAQNVRDNYVGNGVIVNFAFNFPVYTEDDVQVILDGMVQTKTTHYTVRNATDTANFSTLTAAQLPSTGIIKFVTAPANLLNVNLLPLQAAVQQSDYVVEPFPADRVEKDFDKAVMLVRVLREQMRRVLKFATKSLKLDVDGAVDDPVAGKFLRAKDPGPGLDWATPAGVTVGLPILPVNGGTGTAVAGVTKGDLLVGRAGAVFDRRTIGPDGQVLTADSLQVDGVKWAAAPVDPGAIQKSIVTTKGDMIVATGASTPVRLGVGASLSVPEATPADPNGITWQFRARYRFGFAAAAAIAAAVTTYLGSWADSTVEANAHVQHLCTSAGVLRNLFVKASAAPGAGQTFTYTLRKNGVATAITATISGTATTASDIVNEVAVAAGDYITLQLVTSAAAAATFHTGAAEVR